MSHGQRDADEVLPSIDVSSLSYAFPDGSSGLQDVNLNLPPASRTLLIGGNSIPIFGRIQKRAQPDYCCAS